MNQRYNFLLKISCFFFLCFIFSSKLKAQNYGNEWINFGNTYYKFPVWEQRLYRITKAQLNNMGMASVPGSQFAIFREGQEVPIYVTTNGVLGDNDYIEFFGDKANGKMDTQLYPSPADQPNDEYYLITDTAYYFITYNTNTHQRIESVANTIPNPPPAAESYFWWQTVTARPTVFFGGKDISGSDNESVVFLSSRYDKGEGFMLVSKAANSVAYNVSRSTKHKYSGNSSLSATLGLSIVGNSESSTHHAYVAIGSSQLLDTTFGNYDVVKKNIQIPLSLLGASTTNVNFKDASAHGIAKASITYPRTFDFATETTFRTFFQLPNAGGSQYLSFTNFANGGQQPVLLDITNKKRYAGNNASATTTNYYVNPTSLTRQMFITPESEIGIIQNFYPVHFIDHTIAANQGDYIILTHKDFMNASDNYINDYKQYRSGTGGGYNVVVVDVTELYDQYGMGFNYNPLGLKNFLRYAYDHWGDKPKFLFIVGKGLLYNQYVTYTDPSQYNFSNALVPTYGNPGSDNLLTDFDNDDVPEISVGRLSAWNNEEIGAYLAKVKAYEQALQEQPTLDNTIWRKTALHIAGGSDPTLQGTLLSALNYCKSRYEDTLIGGKVITVAKNSSDPVQGVADVQVDSVMNAGVGIVTFYGHGSSSSFDYNINDPNVYHPYPKFPIFFGYGCDVAQIYTKTNDKTVGEAYLASVNGGSVAMLASDNFGYTNSLSDYTRSLYNRFCGDQYGKTLGEQIKASLQVLPSNPYMNIHKQCILLQGDPALKLYSPDKRDYYTDNNLISALPTPVTTAMDSFTLRTVVFNLGMATNDSVLVTITKQKSGSSAILYADSVYIPIKFTDTLSVKVPVDRNTDVGLMVYTVSLNADSRFDEITYQNNKATLQLFIADNGLMPVYPQEFAIMHQQDITLKASALNLFGPQANYKIEIDTSALFNSSSKLSTTITSNGGVIKWKPNMTYHDSTVYYWRTASDELVNGEIQWRTSSFIYLANGSDGWNQSHYYQYLRDTPFYGLKLPAATRKFEFGSFLNHLSVYNRVLFGSDYRNISQNLNGVMLDDVGCYYKGTIQIVVFDSVSGRPWVNPPGGGVFDSRGQCAPAHNTYQFEYLYATPEQRNNIIKMIDSVPAGDYILIKNFTVNQGANVWNRKAIDSWQADAAIYGEGNTLYDKFLELGFDQINQFTSNKTFIFFRKKGNNSYPVHQVVSQDSLDIISMDADFNSFPDTGTVTSTIIGPAKKWNSLKWITTAVDNHPENDLPFVKIYGINNQQEETLLYTGVARDTSLSFIPAATYPYVKMMWNSVDNVTRTSPHLKYWRVLFDPVPEAALNPLAFYKFTSDTLAQGQNGNLQIAIENLTPYPMDSMLVKYQLIDANNVQHDLAQKRYKKLLGNDTLIANFDFNPSQYTNNNVLFVEANPHNDQPEQYHPNNLAYIPFMVKGDKENPVLDVTFDGVHILDKDIVSAKPFIKAIMLDENKYLALSDTSLLTLQLAYPPDQTRIETIPFDGNICKFIPANLNTSKKNQASIEFKPTLPLDGMYKLIVSGKDAVGNVAGSAPKYEINFEVENKPTITNVLNYPNPFSTSTAFVFTMTGAQIPSQFKIQIMTVTGKIVREITKNELGPLHIGRNITDYKWDGRDQFGQLLGNGVYLYRVVTSLEGNDIEHRSNADVDKYFKHSFGKMYIMR